MNDAYGQDLACIHDTGFGHWARHAADFAREALERAKLTGGLVVDLGCGSGILAQELCAAGYDVLGIDQSETMIALAREKAPAARFQVGSLLAAAIPPCQAVTAIGECFNYLFDSGHSQQALADLFSRTYQSLTPGGLLIFDAAEIGRVPGPGPAKFHAEGADWAVLVTAEENDKERLLTRRITSFRRVGELFRRSEEVHRLRLLPRSELADQLRSVGFEVQILHGYGAFQFPPGHAGFLASKRR